MPGFLALVENPIVSQIRRKEIDYFQFLQQENCLPGRRDLFLPR